MIPTQPTGMRFATCSLTVAKPPMAISRPVSGYARRKTCPLRHTRKIGCGRRPFPGGRISSKSRCSTRFRGSFLLIEFNSSSIGRIGYDNVIEGLPRIISIPVATDKSIPLIGTRRRDSADDSTVSRRRIKRDGLSLATSPPETQQLTTLKPSAPFQI